MAFAVIIIIAVYLPILFLQGMEGRMFRPMAITVCTALAGSLLLALTMVPMLASFSFRKGIRPAKRKRHPADRTTLDDCVIGNGLYARADVGHAVPYSDGAALADRAWRRARIAVLHRHRIYAEAR